MNHNIAPTSCCDDYGNCNQGRNCPVRSTPVDTRNGGARIDTDMPKPTNALSVVRISILVYAVVVLTCFFFL